MFNFSMIFARAEYVPMAEHTAPTMIIKIQIVTYKHTTGRYFDFNMKEFDFGVAIKSEQAIPE